MNIRLPAHACLATMLAAGGLLRVVPAVAADYCVDSSVELVQALAATAASSTGDTIRVVQGSYQIDGSLQSLQDGSIRLLGGYNSGCLFRTGYASSTVISGPAPAPNSLRSAVLHLGLDGGDNRIERLQFRNFARVLVTDNGVAATLTVNQNRFQDNDTGLAINVRDTDLVIQNNHFQRNRNLCCGGSAINRGLLILRSTPAQPTTLDINFNTVTASAVGVDIRGAGPYSSTPRLQNNVLWSNSAFDLALDVVDVVATNNLWDSESLTGGSGFTTLLNQLDDNPLLQADGSLTVPNSPAINSGTGFIVGGVPARDVAGNPRQVGSAPDRGAFESGLSDVTDLVVTTTADSGPGSLRQAILDANNTLGGATISFDIPGSCPQLIAPATDLPALVRETYIDGWSQPGSQRNGSEDGYDAVHCIGIIGGGERQDGLRLHTQDASEQSSVYGLSFYGFTRYGIHVNGPGSASIEGNTFGTGLPLVFFEPGFGAYPIRVHDARYTTIGGHSPEQRNVIGRPGLAAIRMENPRGSTIVDNFIGVGTNGTSNIGSADANGIVLMGGEELRVEYNRIGHLATGVLLNSDVVNVVVQSNHIGTTPAGVAIPNAGDGIEVIRAFDVRVRDNDIAHNAGAGIRVDDDAQLVTLEYNRIHANGELGIDIDPPGVNPEDTDTGAGTDGNRFQNAPELLLAEGSDSSGLVEGVLRSSNGAFTIEVHASESCDPSGFGEGRYPGSARHPVTIQNGTASSDGEASFSIPVLAQQGLGSLLGAAITATATFEGDTSEFSACIVYQAGSEVFADGFE